MKKNNFLLSGLSLKRNILIAISLITILPLIVLAYYFFNYYISIATIFILIFVVILGWGIVFGVIFSVRRIYTKSQESFKNIERVEGRLGKDMEVLKGGHIKNEVESLDVIFGMLSTKVKDSVKELKELSYKTEELNREIAQKVDIFSSILETNVLFSKDTSTGEIFQFLAKRLREIIKVNAVIFFLEKVGNKTYDFFFSGVDTSRLNAITENKDFNSFIKIRGRTIVDNEHNIEKAAFLSDLFGFKNIIVEPIFFKKNIIGFAVVSNQLDDFTFSNDTHEAVDIFVQNIINVWEHHRLSRKIEDLEILDPLMNIYNGRYFFQRLEEEIKRAKAYQRPCGLLVIRITNYEEYKKNLKLIELENILKRLIGVFKTNVRPIDILGRIKEDGIGVILIEMNKRQSQHIGAKLKEMVNSFLKQSTNIIPQVSFAIAENPIDGMNASELSECIQAQLNIQ